MISYNPHIFWQFPSSLNNVITFKNRLFRLWNWFFITKVNKPEQALEVLLTVSNNTIFTQY